MHINGLRGDNDEGSARLRCSKNGRIIDELSASGRSSKPCEGFSQARGFFP
jgi:hypothetical protein